MDGNPNEWAVAFHATSIGAVKPICKKGGKFFSTVEEGARGQSCCNKINMNKYRLSTMKPATRSMKVFCMTILPYIKPKRL